MVNYKQATKCIQSGYVPKNGEPRILPICQSTTFKYDDSAHVGDLFDLKKFGHMYSRISNPTVEAVEAKINDLEGGVGALCTSSGQAATLIAILNIAQSGDNIVSLINIYGGSLNLFNVTLKKLGIETRFIEPDMSEEKVKSLFDEKTKLVFAETLSNPSLAVLDIEYYANLAHSNKVPLIVDNTFATPILCNPFKYGADIIIHSTSKYMDGHASVIGGVLIDSGNFDWTKSDKFKELNTPDESYHGVNYVESFKSSAYIVKARVQLMRDFGCTAQPMAAFILNLGLETLDLRIRKHSENALKIAEYLCSRKEIINVNYPGLKNNKYNELVNKYFTDGLSSGVVSFCIEGGKEKALKFIDSLKLISLVVHVADARTSILHPASTSHRQLTKEQLEKGGISDNFLRLSVGIEDSDDLIEDIEQALNIL